MILAVSLALMALLVATAGTAPRGDGHPGAVASDAHRPSASGNRSATAPGGRRRRERRRDHEHDAPRPPYAPAQTSTTGAGSALLDTTRIGDRRPFAFHGPTHDHHDGPTHDHDDDRAKRSAAGRPHADPGLPSPPLQTSNSFAFTGTGAMQISVLWSGSTYLTMKVSCPNGSQSVGGTAAMAASCPTPAGAASPP